MELKMNLKNFFSKFSFNNLPSALLLFRLPTFYYPQPVTVSQYRLNQVKTPTQV